MKICVTGAKGRLGSQLVLMGCTPLECDVTKVTDIERSLSLHIPDVVINCAAFTNVDECETKEGWKKASNVNFRGVENLRNTFTGRLIHISTDYIFNGKIGAYTENYKEYDPINLYGSSKLGGDIVLLNPIDASKETCIVRTTGLYGGAYNQHDFAKMVIETLLQGKELKVTHELMGNQTYIPHLAEAIIKLAGMEWKYKIINVGSEEVISRYYFSLMVASVFGLDKELLIPCTNKEIEGWKAPRPKKAGLKTTLAKRLRLPIYTVLDGIKRYRDDTKGL